MFANSYCIIQTLVFLPLMFVYLKCVLHKTKKKNVDVNVSRGG